MKRTVHNHDVGPLYESLAKTSGEEVKGIDGYAGRVLASTNPGDAIQLPECLKGGYRSIRRHYREIGLPCGDQIIWHTNPEYFGRNGNQPSVFLFGPEFNQFAPDPKWLEMTRQMNSKNRFVAICHDLGLPVPETFWFDSVDYSLVDETMPHLSYPLYWKADVSASGLGVIRCENKSELERVLASTTGAFQLQHEISGVKTFLNVQYVVSSNGLRHLATTEQILDGCVHQGNRHPTIYNPREVTDPLAEWMVERGMKGVFAFDLAVVGEYPDHRYYLIECNPRWNGSTYYTIPAAKLGITEWEGRNFHTDHRSLDTINLRGLAFSKKRGDGVVIINWGTVREGKLGVLVAGGAAKRAEIVSELEGRLAT